MEAEAAAREAEAAAREAEAAAREAEEVRKAEFKKKAALRRRMMSESETGLLAAAGRRHERSGRSGTLRSPVSGLRHLLPRCHGRRMPWKTRGCGKVLDTNIHLQMH